jgi:serine protease AprX
MNKDLYDDYIQRALKYAGDAGNDIANINHLLLSILDSNDAATIFSKNIFSIKRLRISLNEHINNEARPVLPAFYEDVALSADLLRVLQRAFSYRTSGAPSGSVAIDLLRSLLQEKDSPAVGLLRQFGMTRSDEEIFGSVAKVVPDNPSAGVQDSKKEKAAPAVDRVRLVSSATKIEHREKAPRLYRMGDPRSSSVSNALSSGIGLNPTVSDRFKLFVDDGRALEHWPSGNFPGVAVVGFSQKLKFATVKKEPRTRDSVFVASLEQLCGRLNASLAPERHYDLEHGQAFDPTLEDAWLEGDGHPVEGTLDDVLVRIEAANLIYPRSNRVVIAVVDTGIDGQRPEFPAATKQGGWASPGLDPWKDKKGHGTMCACIAAGSREAGGRFQGVAPITPLMSCRVPGLVDGDLALIYERLAEMAEQGHIVIATNSFGWHTTHAPMIAADLKFPEALDNAIAAGVCVVFSAGNNHHQTTPPAGPCAPNTIWQHKGRADVLTVGTCDLEGAMWHYSSRGPGQFPGMPGHSDKPDVVAPTPRNGLIASCGGQNVVIPQGWGTSGAAPQVAGLLAILLSVRPDAPRDELFDIVRQTAVPLGHGRFCEGHGLINCRAAMAQLNARA